MDIVPSPGLKNEGRKGFKSRGTQHEEEKKEDEEASVWKLQVLSNEHEREDRLKG